MICFMHHYVNYSHIVLSLGIKVGREVMKLARNGIFRLLRLKKPNIEVYDNLMLNFSFLNKNIFIIENKSDKDMLVRPL